MNTCSIHNAGTVELYFYDELDAPSRAEFEQHLRSCGDCAKALEELRTIRDALATRPDVAGPASGEWTSFMTRLDASIARPHGVIVPFPPQVAAARRPVLAYVAMAALLALVTISVLVALRAGRTISQPAPQPEVQRTATLDPAEVVPVAAGLRSVGLRHLERSKLVVLGLAAKEPHDGAVPDWTYERELASSLLADTRLYRMAAEERGLDSLAGVMKDLELVLLQTSMAQGTDATALPQIQRLIRKRGLVEKMDVVGTTGLLP